MTCTSSSGSFLMLETQERHHNRTPNLLFISFFSLRFILSLCSLHELGLLHQVKAASLYFFSPFSLHPRNFLFHRTFLPRHWQTRCQAILTICSIIFPLLDLLLDNKTLFKTILNCSSDNSVEMKHFKLVSYRWILHS